MLSNLFSLRSLTSVAVGAVIAFAIAALGLSGTCFSLFGIALF